MTTATLPDDYTYTTNEAVAMTPAIFEKERTEVLHCHGFRDLIEWGPTSLCLWRDETGRWCRLHAPAGYVRSES